MRNQRWLVIGAGIVLIVLIFLVPWCARIVPAGYAGVVTSFGRVDSTPLQSGLNFVAPWKNVVLQDIRVQVFDDRYECPLAEMQSCHIRFILNYARKPEETPQLLSEIGDNTEILRNKIFDPAVKATLKSVMGNCKIAELSTKRPEIIENIRKELTEWIGQYHLQLLEVSLADIQFSPMYREAVEVKQVEEQRAEKAKFELQRTQTLAKISEVKAQGEAEARMEAARGEAEAVKLRAQAESKAIEIEAAAQSDAYRIVAESYRPNLLLRDQVKVWNGKPIPVMVGTDSLLPLTPAIRSQEDWFGTEPLDAAAETTSTNDTATESSSPSVESNATNVTKPTESELPPEVIHELETQSVPVESPVAQPVNEPNPTATSVEAVSESVSEPNPATIPTESAATPAESAETSAEAVPENMDSAATKTTETEVR